MYLKLKYSLIFKIITYVDTHYLIIKILKFTEKNYNLFI